MLHTIEMWWINRPSQIRKRRAEAVANYAAVGLTNAHVRELADYNGRCSRGVVHTPHTDERMADLQARFDQAAREGAWS